VHSPVRPSAFTLPRGDWSTLLDCLCDSFPAVDRAVWRDRFARGRVLDANRQPLDIDTPHREGVRIFYFREVANEKLIPFHEAIIHADDHLIVADKPHFLPVTPAGEYVEQTLLTRLMHRFDNPDLTPLHRIDRHTAGLVLLSANRHTRDAYQALFRNRHIEKLYEAIAPALPQQEFPLTRKTRIARGEPFFLSREIDGEPNSETRMEVIERNGDWWRYALYPVTGKKHQLRVHLAALGAPIRFDAMYPQVQKILMDDYARPLQLLAKRLRFPDPLSGALREFHSKRQLSW
jgi:tRNA pseudouridine32 synthase/23S rRNA pseudouridine746 synthase